MRGTAILSLGAFVLLLGVSGSALATRFRISDPPATTPIYEMGVPVDVGWEDCATDDVCAAFINVSGSTITSLVFQFTATDVLAGQTLTCDAEGVFSFNDCDSLPVLVSGQTYTFRFWGGSIASDVIPPAIAATPDGVGTYAFAPNSGPGFQVDMDQTGLTALNAPMTTMTPFAVPEPGVLGVFGLGLLLLGLGIGARRRWQ